MAKPTVRAKTAAGARGAKPAFHAATKSVEVKDLPPKDPVKGAVIRRIVNVRANAAGIGMGGSTAPSPLPAKAVLPSASGGHMTKAKKKKAKPATSRKATKKSVAVKDLGAKGSKSMKTGITALRRRIV